VTWQYGQRHTWANERPTRGTSRLVEKGATWPNQGLPRGTPGFANIGYVKNCLGPGGFEPATSPLSTPSQTSLATIPPCVLVIETVEIYIYCGLNIGLAGGRAGA
jgi:hypothetical protein